MDEKLQGIRAWLLLRLRELSDGVTQGMASLSADDAHHLADLEELASDVSVDGTVFEQLRSSSDTMAQIEHAIEQLEAGAYGTCEDCDQAISPDRLEALPWATQCVACKRAAEKLSREH